MNGMLATLTGMTPVPNGRSYVLACEYTPKTYGLGQVQRAILAHLATVPVGFDTPHMWDAEGILERHGLPIGVTVRALSSAVYTVPTPDPNHLRTVQRNVRRLEALGLVECWHGEVDTKESAYTTARGFTAPMPVSGLYVALRWQCAHLGGVP